jgi:hypothetical protein
MHAYTHTAWRRVQEMQKHMRTPGTRTCCDSDNKHRHKTRRDAAAHSRTNSLIPSHARARAHTHIRNSAVAKKISPCTYRDTNTYLGLAVGPEPSELAVVPALGELGSELGGEQVRHGVHLGGLVGGISEHQTLVTGAEVLLSLALVHSLWFNSTSESVRVCVCVCACMKACFACRGFQSFLRVFSRTGV